MKAKKFDSDFDQGKDITGSLDLSKARRPKQQQKRVNVDFPIWIMSIFQPGWLKCLIGRLGDWV